MQIAMPKNRDFAEVTWSRMEPVLALKKNQTKL